MGATYLHADGSVAEATILLDNASCSGSIIKMAVADAVSVVSYEDCLFASSIDEVVEYWFSGTFPVA